MKLRKSTAAVLVVALAVAMLLAAGCAPAGPKKVVVWSFTNEVGQMLEYYKKSPGYDPKKVEIEFVLVPNDVYQSKIDPVLQSGVDAPDVFTLEAAFVKKYVETGYMDDLSALKKSYADSAKYPLDVTTDKNGKVVGLSWQVTPGAYFYRRSLAKKYLGTDDPEAVQAMLKDNAAFLATAEELKQKSKGKCVIISSLGDIFKVYNAGRTNGWVVDGKLVVDPLMVELLEQAKLLHDKGYEGRQGQWGEGWFAGMKGNLKDEKGKEIEVFGYFLPTWGLHYVLKPNSKTEDGKFNTTGDWAMIQGPTAWFWGGTWVAVRKGSKVRKEAQELVRYFGSDPEFLEQWAKDTGDVVSNLKVQEKIKDTYSEPFLGGQNHYAAFVEMAKGVNAKTLTGYDQTIESLWQEQQNAFVNGEKDLQKALADFKDAVKNSLPDLKVE
jgi:multiple sugar transport system substrate-binding protein